MRNKKIVIALVAVYLVSCTFLIQTTPLISIKYRNDIKGTNKESNSDKSTAPQMSAPSDPQLLSPRVSPERSSNNTQYNFSVWYYHSENQLPSFVNITINETEFLMSQVDPSDNNAQDGIEYYYLTTLEFGYYKFQINCSDGVFTNSTDWIYGPEVNPFLTQPEHFIILNEIFDDITQYIELYNFGSDQDMTGWTIETIMDNGNIEWDRYYFPTGWIFKKNYVVGINFFEGTNTDTVLYTGYFLPFGATGSLAVGLFDNNGNNVDWFQTSTHTVFFPSDAKWKQDIDLYYLNGYAARKDDYDRNRASDWKIYSSSSKFSLNPGQYGIWDYSYIHLLGPSNESEFLSDTYEFEWSSLNAPFGSVNYTIQISDTYDFSNVIYEQTEIQNTPSTTSVLIDLIFPTNQYYWRVRRNYGTLKGNWSHIFTFNLTLNEVIPSLSISSPPPYTGDQFSVFNFTTIYTDQDNNPPTYVNVTINGIDYLMEKVNQLDMDFTDGCRFQYLTSLAPSENNYTYSFSCGDGRYTYSTITYDNLEVIETNNYQPKLINPQVSPELVNNTTLFNFTVWYYDDDNNLPIDVNITINNDVFSMFPVDPSDQNALNGIFYYFTIVLDFGYHSFQMNTFDGKFTNSTYEINKPEVNPFFKCKNIALKNPPNNSIIYNNWINFSWTSLELPYCAVNYSLIFSNTSDFTHIIYEINDISETEGYSNISLNLNVKIGQYFWRVRPTYGIFYGNWTDTFIINISEPIQPPPEDGGGNGGDSDDDDIDGDDGDIFTIYGPVTIVGVVTGGGAIGVVGAIYFLKKRPKKIRMNQAT
ncbi:MAG: lamin tail domain-containing protein [Candidatus Hodarchaeota archaeon]